MVLGGRRARVVHDAEMHDGLDVAGPEDVFELLPADVDLSVLDVLGLVVERPAIDADDGAVAVEHARQLLSEAAADARDENGAAGGRRNGRRPRSRSGSKGGAVAHPFTRRCAFAP